jgi:hypothetical protein
MYAASDITSVALENERREDVIELSMQEQLSLKSLESCQNVNKMII